MLVPFLPIQPLHLLKNERRILSVAFLYDQNDYRKFSSCKDNRCQQRKSIWGGYQNFTIDGTKEVLIKMLSSGTSLVVQWLRLHSRGHKLDPWSESLIALQCSATPLPNIYIHIHTHIHIKVLMVPWMARRSTLNIHWKDWCWSFNTLATWCKELTH